MEYEYLEIREKQVLVPCEWLNIQPVALKVILQEKIRSLVPSVTRLEDVSMKFGESETHLTYYGRTLCFRRTEDTDYLLNLRSYYLIDLNILDIEKYFPLEKKKCEYVPLHLF